LSAGEKPEVRDSPALGSENHTADLNERWTVPGVCIFLVAITFAVFGQTLRYGFVSYDDNMYVYDDAQVTRGLTLNGISQAFTHGNYDNWDPLTTISHMLDCQLYGLDAGGHHLTNVLLHTAAVILLFLVLRRMTGFLWRSAFVAAVFAVHPLRVESVAWVAERKDVLSGVFFMLTLGAYVRYVQKQPRVEEGESRTPAPAPGPRLWTLDYFLVLLCFALGLMCKPMLVTLPLVLLLLDYWPLGRVMGGGWRVTRSGVQVHQLSTLNHLLYEKLPLFGLAVASGVVTIFAQARAIQPFDKISLPLRLENALISYVVYMGQMFWPRNLAVLYPFTTKGVGITGVVLSVVVLAGISAGAFVLRRQRAYILTGWLWYLIMLVPVIGILQVGSQARADRYAYLPQIGLYVVLTWAVAELSGAWRWRRGVLVGLSTIILGSLILCSGVQVAYWRDSESLWTHTLACTSDNAIADSNFGVTLIQKGSVDEAIVHYQEALKIKPDYAEAYYNFGNALLRKGSVDEAIVKFQKALEIKPNFLEACYNLGNSLLQKGRMDEAIAYYQKALKIKPDCAQACSNLGYCLFQKGSVDEAIAYYQKALEIKPDYAEARNNLNNALLQKDNMDNAITNYQKALQIKPDSLEVLNNLAWLLATCPDAHIRDGVQAVKYAGRACALTHYQKTIMVGTLAAAYAEAGRFDDAVAAAEKACALASAAGEPDLLEKNQKLLALYRARQPYHEAAEKFVPAAP
jgi:tetratricopeptide (TPR) repeat protein